MGVQVTTRTDAASSGAVGVGALWAGTLYARGAQRCSRRLPGVGCLVSAAWLDIPCDLCYNWIVGSRFGGVTWIKIAMSSFRLVCMYRERERLLLRWLPFLLAAFPWFLAFGCMRPAGLLLGSAARCCWASAQSAPRRVFMTAWSVWRGGGHDRLYTNSLSFLVRFAMQI